MPERTFTLSPQLPYELRRLIWVKAFCAPLSSAYYADKKLHPESYNAQFLPFPSVPLLHPYCFSRRFDPDEEDRIRELSDIRAFLERTYGPDDVDDVARTARREHAKRACRQAVRDYHISRWRFGSTSLSIDGTRSVGNTIKRVANTLAAVCPETAAVRESLVQSLGDPRGWIDITGRVGQRDNNNNNRNNVGHGGVFAFVDSGSNYPYAGRHNHPHLVPDIPLDDQDHDHDHDHPTPAPFSIHGQKTLVTATTNVRELVLSWYHIICVPALLTDSERAQLAPDYQATPAYFQWRDGLVARLRNRHPHLQCIYLLDQRAEPVPSRLDPATHTLVFRGPAQSFYHVKNHKDWANGHYAAFNSTYRDRVPRVAVLLARALNMVRPPQGDEPAVWHERKIEVRLLGCVPDDYSVW